MGISSPLGMVSFIKREIVFVIAAAAAVITAFFNPPSAGWIESIDFRTLAMMFSLMGISEGLRSSGFFDSAAGMLMRRSSNTRTLSYLLVAIVFISSMFFTNDVSLLMFVPFTMMLLDKSGADERSVILVTVLETISANLGSMTTPVGNPQNLYICSFFGVEARAFFSAILPYSAISAIMIAILAGTLLRRGKELESHEGEIRKPDRERSAVFIAFLALAMLAVFDIISWKLLFISEAIAIFFVDRRIYRKIDYILLLTFVAFFIFSENIRNIEEVNAIIASPMKTHPIAVSAATSQVISNVPAAILLSSFAEDFRGVLVGTDIGGLGTPVASLASLISLKFYFRRAEGSKGRYMLIFLAMNFMLLAILGAFSLFLS